MTALPASYAICPRRRADYVLSLQFKDPSAVPIDITGWTVLAQMWEKSRNRKLADFGVTILDAEEGRVELTLDYETTAELPDTAYYDVLVIDLGERHQYYLEGDVRVAQGYTEPV